MDGDKRKQLESILENMKKENEQSQPSQESPPRTPPPQDQGPPPSHYSDSREQRGSWGDSPQKQRRPSVGGQGGGPGSKIL